MPQVIPPPQRVILFIEDQESHYDQVAAYLRLHNYTCRRIGRSEFARVGVIARELNPLAAVVDINLPSSSQRDVDEAARRAIEGTSQPAAAVLGEDVDGITSIPILRQVCPTIKILLYTQHAKADDMPSQVKIYHADAGVAKQRASGHLTDANAQEIAAKVRALIER
jgi:hypothetical protein